MSLRLKLFIESLGVLIGISAVLGIAVFFAFREGLKSEGSAQILFWEFEFIPLFLAYVYYRWRIIRISKRDREKKFKNTAFIATLLKKERLKGQNEIKDRTNR